MDLDSSIGANFKFAAAWVYMEVVGLKVQFRMLSEALARPARIVS